MTVTDIKARKSVYWISAIALLAAGSAWAEDDIPPLDPLVTTFLKFLRDLWVLISDCAC